MHRQGELTAHAVTRRVTLNGAVVDFLLGVIKIAAGWFAHSQALVADGIHSLSDLATDYVVVVASRHAARDADAQHPYGHNRIETAASVLLAAVLAFVAIAIAWNAAARLLSGTPIEVPGMIALVVAAGSALVKEGVYWYTVRAARRIGSRLLEANAWHSRSDALSSLVVLAGVGGAFIGFPWADAVAAIGVAALILQVAWSISNEGISELIDTGLDKEELLRIRETVLSVDGVRDMHELRTRRMGAGVLADMHVHVPSAMSVSEGHRIADEVYLRLRQHFDYLDDVIVHIDCEDDTDQRPSSGLPLRPAVEARVRDMVEAVYGSADVFRRLTLHYLGGKIHMELWLAPGGGRIDVQSGADTLRARLQSIPNTGGVTLLTEIR